VFIKGESGRARNSKAPPCAVFLIYRVQDVEEPDQIKVFLPDNNIF
jgi:hypothetical protein